MSSEIKSSTQYTAAAVQQHIIPVKLSIARINLDVEVLYFPKSTVSYELIEYHIISKSIFRASYLMITLSRGITVMRIVLFVRLTLEIIRSSV